MSYKCFFMTYQLLIILNQTRLLRFNVPLASASFRTDLSKVEYFPHLMGSGNIQGSGEGRVVLELWKNFNFT